jgi:hypothetical protein
LQIYANRANKRYKTRKKTNQNSQAELQAVEVENIHRIGDDGFYLAYHRFLLYSFIAENI